MHFVRVIECGVFGVPVRGLVVTSNPDHSVVGVPGAVFCETYRALTDGCADPIGRTGNGGAFDFKVAFSWSSTNSSTQKEEERILIVSAPGCTPQQLRVRDDRAPHRVALDCQQPRSGTPITPPPRPVRID